MTPSTALAPRIVLTGLSHAGLSLAADMLNAGGATFLIAADPHLFDYTSGDARERKTLGILIERDSAAIARAQLKAQGIAFPNRLTLAAASRQTVKSAARARDEAARIFAPIFTFRFEDIIRDPSAQAARFARLFWPNGQCADLGPAACPNFDTRRAALTVRRILHVARPAGPRLSIVNPEPA